MFAAYREVKINQVPLLFPTENNSKSNKLWVNRYECFSSSVGVPEYYVLLDGGHHIVRFGTVITHSLSFAEWSRNCIENNCF